MTHAAPDDDDAPTYADVLRESASVRELAQQAAEEQPRWVASIAEKAGKAAGETAGKRVSRRFGVVALIVAFLVPLLVSVLAYGNSVATGRQVEGALERLGEANVTLEARGQEPVVAPDASPEAVTAAAVTAQVLASLPPTPTAEEVAGRLQGAVVGSLTGPTFDELARLVGSYFQANPPQPGPPPTEAQIRGAVEAELARNPPEQGPRGEPGESCLPSIPECVGPRGVAGDNGKDGDPGRSVVSGPEPVLVDGVCLWRTTYDQAPLVEEHPAGPAACPPAVIDPESPPPTG